MATTVPWGISTITVGITGATIVLETVNVLIRPGQALSQNPTLIPGDPSISNEVPFHTLDIALLPAQYPGLFPGQLT